MARWEIQKRWRRNLIGNLGLDNTGDPIAPKYKCGYVLEWRAADRLKQTLLPQIDVLLDTNDAQMPKGISGEQLRLGLNTVSLRPFRVVPYFDPGPWGGHWMEEVCDLPRDKPNHAWCFDCVPEENSLLLGFGDLRVEVPSINLVFAHPGALLGEAVHGRFGKEFPIRFDFLDTMGGGNLSLQVHPLTEYIQDKFGMHYTQDESYYLLDAGQEATVYLGLKEDADASALEKDLRVAQTGASPFPAEKYVNQWPAKKHDHFLIPAGTIHCSGAESMVLEISATPYIFTFKLWDWGRLGMDGYPRPIHIDHGVANIQWDRKTAWIASNLVNQFEKIASGDGWSEERTGLHAREFIETRRHWFTKSVRHDTRAGVNVLNLVEGDEVIVESPSGAFPPFIVHYAETFIVPAAVGAYTITPHGPAKDQLCATIKAFVRIGAN
jgi:mannose-6-phosphate isomerase class I